MSTTGNLKRNGVIWIITLIASFAVATTPGFAAEDTAGWKPAPPMPDEFDWVQTTSGEWLKGEIIAMYNESLEFDSDEFDEQTLDWKDIQVIRSAQICQVRFSNNTIATGKILLENKSIRVIGGRAVERDRSLVLSITPGEPRERNYWAGKISAGLNIRTGNSEQIEFNAKATLIRRTPSSRVNLDYLGNFSESEDTTLTDNQRLEFKWNRYFSNRLYWTPLQGEVFRDRFQNIATRFTGGIGLGYTIMDSSKVDWDVNAGIAYQSISYDDVLPEEEESETSPALTAGTQYEHELAQWLDFHLNYSFNIVNEASGTYTHHLVTGFEFDLVGDLDLDVDWVWDYIKDPRQNSDGQYPEQSDFRMMFNLGYSF